MKLLNLNRSVPTNVAGTSSTRAHGSVGHEAASMRRTGDEARDPADGRRLAPTSACENRPETWRPPWWPSSPECAWIRG